MKKTPLRYSDWMCSRVRRSGIAFGTLVTLLAAPTSHSQVVIGIQGLADAEHWVWMEGEDYTSAPNAGIASFRNNQAVSGYMSGGPANAYVRSGGNPVRSVYYDIYAPAAMSSETNVYARASIAPTSNMAVHVDGNLVTQTNTQIVDSGQTNPTRFLDWQVAGDPPTQLGQGIETGSLTAGNHEFRYQSSLSSGSFMVDGLLLYDGSPDLRGVADNGSGRYWLQNPGSIDSPEIGLIDWAVNPEFTIQGLQAGNQVYYFLNGSAYTPGTEIGPGTDYELVIAVFESSDVNSQRLAFAGANFSVVPEPGVGLLSLAGIAILLIVQHRRSSRKGRFAEC